MMVPALRPEQIIEQVRECRDCRWGQRQDAMYSWHWFCGHPVNRRPRSRIDGRSEQNWIYCENMRKEGAQCGPSGSLFSPINSRWHRVVEFWRAVVS